MKTLIISSSLSKNSKSFILCKKAKSILSKMKINVEIFDVKKITLNPYHNNKSNGMEDLTNKIYAAIDHLGLGEFSAPDAKSDQSKKKPERILTQEEMLDDKLRYLYMMQALHPSLRQKIDIYFKMKKCKSVILQSAELWKN